MTEPRSYPAGVTSWVDLAHDDVEGASVFYGGLFGWTFTEDASSGAADPYLIAQLGGLDTAGIGGVGAHGGVRLEHLHRRGRHRGRNRAGRSHRSGARGGVPGGDGRQIGGLHRPARRPLPALAGRSPTRRPSRQRPWAWNFSDLHAADPAASAAWYADVFGWSVDDIGFGHMIRLPGYGDHLAATSDPEIHERQAAVSAPPGFADAIGWMAPVLPGEEPHWHVTFTVADRDATSALVERLGGTVLSTSDSDWTREVLIRDPQGAVFTASQFAPPRLLNRT